MSESERNSVPPIPLEEGGVSAPRLPGQVVVREDIEDLGSALGAELLIHAHNCVRTFGDFHLALSGGSTPLPFYHRLMVDPMFRSFPWNRTHLWMVDERRVPLEDDRSNYRHIHEILVDHSDIPKANVHPMVAMREDADVVYEGELREVLAWREKGHDRLDFVLLGLGGDGHTASLFPRSPALAERERLVRINAGPTVTPPDRVTMTFPLINATRFVAFLVTGAGKREMVARIGRGRDTVEDVPALGVHPVGGVLKWFIDSDACQH
jgi:6-phosphogluconolactonase